MREYYNREKVPYREPIKYQPDQEVIIEEKEPYTLWNAIVAAAIVVAVVTIAIPHMLDSGTRAERSRGTEIEQLELPQDMQMLGKVQQEAAKQKLPVIDWQVYDRIAREENARIDADRAESRRRDEHFQQMMKLNEISDRLDWLED